jgi:hypothetical protein
VIGLDGVLNGDDAGKVTLYDYSAAQGAAWVNADRQRDQHGWAPPIGDLDEAVLASGRGRCRIAVKTTVIASGFHQRKPVLP